MIESPPTYLTNPETIALMEAYWQDGTLRKIQDEYLYWDKIKYRDKHHSPQALWAAVKLHRNLRSTTVQFGKYRFKYVITDYMQRTLHQFDMHLGGNLGSNIGI